MARSSEIFKGLAATVGVTALVGGAIALFEQFNNTPEQRCLPPTTPIERKSPQTKSDIRIQWKIESLQQGNNPLCIPLSSSVDPWLTQQ